MSATRRARCGSAALLGLLVLRSVANGGDGDFRPAPPFAGDRRPAPPRQKEPWTPPKTSSPRTVVTATETLFAQGLPDPRGCEYRAVELGGSAWFIATHAWVLPAAAPGSPRFAVAWDGLVYPVLELGAAADVTADALAAIRADDALRAREDARIKELNGGQGSYRRYSWGAREGRESAAHNTVLPLKVCYLLRLGEGELARRMWATWVAGLDERTGDDDVLRADPYPIMAGDWTWSLFARGFSAHVRGDDRLALLTLRDLVPIQRATFRAVQERGLQRFVDQPDGTKRAVYLEAPAQLDALLADQERRAREPRRGKLSLEGLDKAGRIAALIRELDEPHFEMLAEGRVTLGRLRETAIARALIAEGEDAVEPLLEVVERDDRLSRNDLTSARYYHVRSRYVAPVHWIASDALSAILGTETFDRAGVGNGPDTSTPAGRRQHAEDIRAYWNKFRGVRQAERWYRTLADDTATAEQWLEAASRVVEPAGAKPLGYRRPPELKRPPGREPRLTGAGLRGKAGPSVAELMARRADDLAEGGLEGERAAVAKASEMALYLSRWDERAALPTLRIVFLRLRAALTLGGDDVGHSALPHLLARVTLARDRGGDRKALDDYADWLRATPRETIEADVAAPFEVLWRRPDHPTIVRLADWLFNDDRSPWVAPLHRLGYHETGLVETPLLAVAGFRRRVLAVLEDRSPAGTVTVTQRGGLILKREGGWTSHTGDVSLDPLAPKSGDPVEFRVCDYYAWGLSHLEGAPRYEVYWPPDRRDEALPAVVAFLQRYGARFGFTEAQEGEHPFSIRARFSLPPLYRPAAPADVGNGLALFSLEGEGERRVVPLSPRPREARWLALKTSPYNANAGVDPDGPPKIAYLQDGRVWQAEEVRRGGTWVRYYGFVGPHASARVPAAEIEFTDEEGKASPSPR